MSTNNNRGAKKFNKVDLLSRGTVLLKNFWKFRNYDEKHWNTILQSRPFI